MYIYNLFKYTVIQEHDMVHNNHADEFKKLLNDRSVNVNARDEKGFTPLTRGKFLYFNELKEN